MITPNAKSEFCVSELIRKGCICANKYEIMRTLCIASCATCTPISSRIAERPSELPGSCSHSVSSASRRPHEIRSCSSRAAVSTEKRTHILWIARSVRSNTTRKRHESIRWSFHWSTSSFFSRFLAHRDQEFTRNEQLGTSREMAPAAAISVRVLVRQASEWLLFEVDLHVDIPSCCISLCSANCTVLISLFKYCAFEIYSEIYFFNPFNSFNALFINNSLLIFSHSTHCTISCIETLFLILIHTWAVTVRILFNLLSTPVLKGGHALPNFWSSSKIWC